MENLIGLGNTHEIMTKSFIEERAALGDLGPEKLKFFGVEYSKEVVNDAQLLQTLSTKP